MKRGAPEGGNQRGCKKLLLGDSHPGELWTLGAGGPRPSDPAALTPLESQEPAGSGHLPSHTPCSQSVWS